MSEELLATTPPTPYDYDIGGLWVSQSEKDLYEGLPVANGLPDEIKLENGRVYKKNEVNRYVWEGEPDFQFDLIFWDYPDYYTFLICSNNVMISYWQVDYGYNNPETHTRVAVGSRTGWQGTEYLPYGSWYCRSTTDPDRHSTDSKYIITTLYNYNGVQIGSVSWSFAIELESHELTEEVFGSVITPFTVNSSGGIITTATAIPRTKCTLAIKVGDRLVASEEIGYIYPSDETYNDYSGAKWTAELTTTNGYLQLNSKAFATMDEARSNYYKLINVGYSINNTWSAFPQEFEYPADMYLGYEGETTITLQQGFTITLYTRDNEPSQFAHVSGTPLSITGVLSEYTDVLRPKLIVILPQRTTDPTLYNYVGGLFNRYYNVTNIKQVGQGVWEYSLEVDVLTTYYDWMLKYGSGWVERSVMTNNLGDTIIDPLKQSVGSGRKVYVGTFTTVSDYIFEGGPSVSALTGTKGNVVVTGLRVADNNS